MVPIIGTGLLREHHDEVARFFAALQPEGAAQAALLPGLSLATELSLAIQRGQFKQYVAACFDQTDCLDKRLPRSHKGVPPLPVCCHVPCLLVCVEAPGRR